MGENNVKIHVNGWVREETYFTFSLFAQIPAPATTSEGDWEWPPLTPRLHDKSTLGQFHRLWETAKRQSVKIYLRRIMLMFIRILWAHQSRKVDSTAGTYQSLEVSLQRRLHLLHTPAYTRQSLWWTHEHCILQIYNRVPNFKALKTNHQHSNRWELLICGTGFSQHIMSIIITTTRQQEIRSKLTK